MTTRGFDGLVVGAFESRLAAEMTRLIQHHGGRARVVPSMREIPLTENSHVWAFGDAMLAGRYDVLILMTGVGTTSLFQLLHERWPVEDIHRACARMTIVARGRKTVAALKSLGLSAHFVVPEPNTWRDVVVIVSGFSGTSVRARRIAVQEYGASNPEMLEALRERADVVDPVPIYRWALPEDRAPLRELLTHVLDGRIDVLLFTNAVQIDHLMTVARDMGVERRVAPAMDRVVVASIGPVTSERLQSLGWPIDCEPTQSKMGVFVKEVSARAREHVARKRG